MSNFETIQTIATPIEIELRWSDQDINGHVNNATILTLIEEARIRATQQWTHTTPGATGPRRVTRALSSSFDREVHYGKKTTAWIWVTRLGRSSFDFAQLLTQDDQPCVYSTATMVVVDAHTGKPTPLDDALRQHLESHLGPGYETRG